MESKTFVAAFMLAMTLAFSLAQRSTYSGPRESSYVPLGNKYNEGSVSPAYENNFDASNVGNRLQNSGAPASSAVGYVDDQYALDYISTWDIDHQPIWYLNNAQISQNKKNPQVLSPASKPFYSG